MALSFVLVVFMIIVYVAVMSQGLSAEKALIEAQKRIVDEEARRGRAIVENLEAFLREAEFFVPIAKWRNEKVYKYIKNGNEIYEFDDFMSAERQQIGMDGERLCFKQMIYKRIAATRDFVESLTLMNMAL